MHIALVLSFLIYHCVKYDCSQPPDNVLKAKDEKIVTTTRTTKKKGKHSFMNIFL